MTEQTYALINNGVVQQLLTTDQNISTLFAPGLEWVLMANPAGVVPGYLYDGTNFTAPTPPTVTVASVSLAELQAQLASIQVAIAALSAAH